MKTFCKSLIFLLATSLFVPLAAQNNKYDENDIKRILFLKELSNSSPSSYVVLEKFHGNSLECTYLGTQQNVTVNKNNVIPTIFYEDSSNFVISQYALIAMFSGQRPNLALGLAKINNDTTGRITALNNFAAAVREQQNTIAYIRNKFPQNSEEQSDALAQLINNDKLLPLVKQAATTKDWYLTLSLLDSYKENILKQYIRNFSGMPELIKEAQTKYAECENELLTNFANKIQQPNMRRAVFQQLYPNARGLWSQPPPTSYAEMKKLLLSSMTSYHNLDNISRIFKPQDWGTAMLNVLLMLEGAQCASEMEKDFDDEMRRLVKRSQRP